MHADDTHAECVSCLGKSHADAARSGTDCTHCESFSLASLCSRIAFFSESDSAPRTLPFSSSQGPVRKKQRGRGFEQPVTSELTSAQCPRASQREHSPVLFTQHDQRPSAAASDMILFGVSDNELDDSLSLAASDAEELSGSVTDPALLRHLKIPRRSGFVRQPVWTSCGGESAVYIARHPSHFGGLWRAA